LRSAKRSCDYGALRFKTQKIQTDGSSYSYLFAGRPRHDDPAEPRLYQPIFHSSTHLFPDARSIPIAHGKGREDQTTAIFSPALSRCKNQIVKNYKL
jgi:hypothetical protein